MATIELGGRTFEVDPEGFLQQPRTWDDSVATLLATTEGIAELTPEHWAVVHYIREYWEANDTAPMIRKLCQATSLNLRTIYKLFPSGPAKGACRVAGLPKPDGCV
jgi:dissimilatory sulfite reductase related protein